MGRAADGTHAGCHAQLHPSGCVLRDAGRHRRDSIARLPGERHSERMGAGPTDEDHRRDTSCRLDINLARLAYAAEAPC